MSGPTPGQVRAAADIIEALNVTKAIYPGSGWLPSELRAEAERIEADERETERVTKLAQEMWSAAYPKTSVLSGGLGDTFTRVAAHLIKSGWRRES